MYANSLELGTCPRKALLNSCPRICREFGDGHRILFVTERDLPDGDAQVSRVGDAFCF